MTRCDACGGRCFGKLKPHSKTRRTLLGLYFNRAYRISTLALLLTCCVFLPNENKLDPYDFQSTLGVQGDLNRGAAPHKPAPRPHRARAWPT